MMKSKIAAIQMCSSKNVDENLKIAETLIIEAAENGAALIVLPEMFAIFGQDATDKILVKEKFGTGTIQDFLSQMAARLKVWIVGGTIPIACENAHKVRSACIVYNDKGEIAGRYDKIHLFDVTLSETESYKESDTKEAGTSPVVVDTPFGKLGLAICYDIRFPALFTHLFQQGAEILVIPAAFTAKTGAAHWHLLTRARAVENFCYVIGADQGGAHANGCETYGHSLIVEPWGSIVAELPNQEKGIAYAEIDLSELYKIRKSIPVKDHQKIAIDFLRLNFRRS